MWSSSSRVPCSKIRVHSCLFAVSTERRRNEGTLIYMAVFQYRGLDKSGRAVAGTMAAEDAINLEEKLRASGYWLLDAQAKEGTQTSRKAGSTGAIAWGTG